MKHIIGISLMGIFIVTVYYFSVGTANFISPDTWTYIDASEMLYNTLKPHPTRPMGYSLISGLPKLFIPDLSNQSYMQFAVIINLLAWLGTQVFLYKSLRLYFSPTAAFVGTIPFLFTFTSIGHIFQMMTESLVLFLLSAISFCVLKYSKERRLQYLVLATTLLNFAALIRPGLIYLAIGGTFISVFLLVKAARKKQFRSVISLFLGSIMFIAVQYQMMYKEYGVMTPSFIDKVTWYTYLGAATYADATEQPLQEVKVPRHEFLADKTYKKISEIGTIDVKKQLRNRPQYVAKNWILSIIRNSIAGSAVLRHIVEKECCPSTLIKTLYLITRLQNTVFTLLFGIALLVIISNPFKQEIGVYFLSSIVAYVIATSGISFHQGDRFHFILYPVITILFLLVLKKTQYAPLLASKLSSLREYQQRYLFSTKNKVLAYSPFGSSDTDTNKTP